MIIANIRRFRYKLCARNFYTKCRLLIESFHLDFKRWQYSADNKAVIIVTNLVTSGNDPVADNDADIIIINAHTRVVNQSSQNKYSTISCRFINLNCAKYILFSSTFQCLLLKVLSIYLTMLLIFQNFVYKLHDN